MPWGWTGGFGNFWPHQQFGLGRLLDTGWFRANLGGEPPFLLRGLSYMRDLPLERADSSRERIGGVDGGGGLMQKSRSDIMIDPSADRHFNRGMAW